MAALALRSTHPQIQWKWMQDDGSWADYDYTSNLSIERDYVSGAGHSMVNSATGGLAGNGATYHVVFSDMNQRNSRTGFTRDVKREVGGNTTSSENWSWNRNSRWELLPLRVCLQIITSRDARSENITAARIGGELYVIDSARLTAMNTNTRENFRLRREGSGATATAVAAAAAAGAGAAGASARGGARFSANHDQEAEFQGVITSASDCTSSIGSDEICPVCMDGFSLLEPALLLPRCQGHYIHGTCAMNVFRSLGAKCPTCSVMYAVLRGDQPNGEMKITRHPPGRVPLSGYESVGTFMIEYRFSGGVQGPKHPNPGRSYRGTTRQAYLPDNEDGREVLELLRKSFDRKMTFTIGTSVTTGISNSIVWNGIHHKTRVSGGAAHYGYPDSTYFARVKAELASKGIR